MRLLVLLAAVPLFAQVAVLPPGTSGEVRLVAKPLPMAVYRHMTGLGANDAGLWVLIAKNTTRQTVTVGLDDWQLACPGVTFLDAVAAGALLARDSATSKQAVTYQLLELASAGIATAVNPFVAFALPVLMKMEGLTKDSIPNPGVLLASMQGSITVGPDSSGHTYALAGKVHEVRSCGGFR